MSAFNEIHWASWLEEQLREMITEPIENICILTKFDSGDVSARTYECTTGDYLLFSGLLQQEALIATLKDRGLVSEDEEDGQEEMS